MGKLSPYMAQWRRAAAKKRARRFLSNNSLQPVNIAESTGKVRIISVVPSLDTPTCDAQTHELSEKNNGLDQSVELITVSMDLPFAQSRFAEEANISYFGTSAASLGDLAQ